MKNRFFVVILLIFSSGHFQHASAQLKLLSPNGQEVFTVGNVIPILWKGVADSVPINIEFSEDNGATWRIIAEDVKGNRFLWSVPIVNPTSQCRIKVTTTVTQRDSLNFVFSFKGHTRGVNGVDISSDGKLLVTAGSDGRLILWDMNTKEQLKVMDGESGPIYFARFNSSGSQIATSHHNGMAIIWNVQTGKKEKVFSPGHGIVWPVAFSPNDSVLLTGNDDGTISIWNVFTGQNVNTFKPHNEAVRFIEYTKDGSRIIASSTDRTASIINMTSLKRIAEFKHYTPGVAGANVIVNGVQLSPDESTAITCGYDGYVKFWRISDGQLVKSEEYHGGAEASELQVSPNGQWMASTGYDGSVKIVSPYTGEIIFNLQPKLSGMIRSKFSADNRYLAVSHFDGQATLWELPLTQMDISDEAWSINACDEEVSNVESDRRSPSFYMNLY